MATRDCSATDSEQGGGMTKEWSMQYGGIIENFSRQSERHRIEGVCDSEIVNSMECLIIAPVGQYF